MKQELPGPSTWFKAHHWLLSKNHSLAFLKDMKNRVKNREKITEKDKHGIINCYKSRSGKHRLQGMYARQEIKTNRVEPENS